MLHVFQGHNSTKYLNKRIYSILSNLLEALYIFYLYIETKIDNLLMIMKNEYTIKILIDHNNQCH